MAIKDIELRFVERTVMGPGFGVSETSRVLEWRKLIERPWIETWVNEGRECPRSGLEQVWTDWAPVPYVAGV